MSIRWREYETSAGFDEVISSSGRSRPIARQLARHFARLKPEALERLTTAVKISIEDLGITFNVYNRREGSIDRAWPLDLMPRVMAASEWRQIEKGLKQRVRALNAFIDDIYNEQSIIKDGVFPAELLENSANFRPECVGVRPRGGIWAHICGSDLVRDADGTVYVLEDNLRVPSGVSYMLENRHVIKRVLPDLFEKYRVLPVDEYPAHLFDLLAAESPRADGRPEVVVLTPGVFNSAYFEHAYLAQQMGCELVEGRDLTVDNDDCVYMRTIDGLAKVDVIYRRIDDLFLDPEAFNPESTLGVAGLMRAWRNGKVALVNAPGAGVADDKVVYAYVPDMISYYLDEKAIMPNVPTYLCHRADDRAYVLEHLSELVVKPANESGGYGMLMGPASTGKMREQFARQIQRNPRNFIAQPVLSLSTVPTVVDQGRVAARHVDLRPFILSGEDVKVTTGGLTRVAMVEGSLVVNSSQGGGSKDTWIVEEEVE